MGSKSLMLALCCTALMLAGCSGNSLTNAELSVVDYVPTDVRIEYDGLSYKLMWEYEPRILDVKYEVHFCSDGEFIEDSTQVLAEVFERRITVGMLGEYEMFEQGGYLAVRAVDEKGVKSPFSEPVPIAFALNRPTNGEFGVPEEIIVVDLRSEVHDLDTLLMVKCIQGLVNRETNMPKIYVLHRAGGPRGDSVIELTPGDLRWLMVAQERLGAELVRMTPEELFEAYKDYLNGQVIYDKNKTENVEPFDVEHYWTVPLAVTYAGISDAVVTSTEIPGLPIIFDFRDKDWTKLEAYQWAIDELLPKVRKEVVFLNDAFAAYNTDYIIDKQAFFMDLDSTPGTKEREIALQILESYSNITPVHAWTHKYGSGEYNIIKLVDESGQTNIADVGGTMTNFSFHSRIAASKPMVQHTRFHEYDPDSYYVTFIYSDGDALGYINQHLYQWWHWNENGRGNVPIGWQMSPYLGIICPYMLETYYNESTLNDHFVMAVNGYGYSLPGRRNRLGTLEEYLYETENLLSIMDFRSICIVDYEPEMSSIDAWIEKYAKKAGIDALFIEGGAIDETIGPVQSQLYARSGPVQRVFDKPDGDKLATFVMAHRGRFVDEASAVSSGEQPGDNVVGAITSIINDPMKNTRFIYVYVFVYYMNPTMVWRAASDLPENVKVVGPDEFAYLFKEHQYGKEGVTNEATVRDITIRRGREDENVLFVSASVDDRVEYVDVLYELEGIDGLFVRRMKDIGGGRYVIDIPEWTKDGRTDVHSVSIRIRTKDKGVTIKELPFAN